MARESGAEMARGAAQMKVNEVWGSRYLLLDHWLASPVESAGFDDHVLATGRSKSRCRWSSDATGAKIVGQPLQSGWEAGARTLSYIHPVCVPASCIPIPSHAIPHLS